MQWVVSGLERLRGTRWRVPAAALLVVLALGGCGWRLQGAARLPSAMQTVHIHSANTYSDFYRELRARLLEAGAQLTTDERAAQAVVRIESDVSGQRVASVSARNTPEQYEVYYAIEFSVNLNGTQAIAKQPMELTANYSFDSAYDTDATVVLAKQREQLSMQRALARELAAMVVRRMTSSAAQPSAMQPSTAESAQ